jgi:hypothetical protein
MLQLDQYQVPEPEQLQLLASDYITRIMALMQKRQARQALVRVTQLNALVQEFPQLQKAYPGLSVFIRYGGHFCSSPKRLNATAIYLMYQKAAPLLKRMTHAVSDYVQEQTREAEAAAPNPEQRKPNPKLVRLGNSLAALQAIMPKVLEEDRLRSQADRERYETKHAGSASVVSADDTFILDQAGQAPVYDLAASESTFVRLALVLQEAYVSKVVQQAMCVEYGIYRVMGSYWLMTEALLVGVARRSESGEVRSDVEMNSHAAELVRLRNITRERAHQPGLVQVGPARNSVNHRYFLVFDRSYTVENQFSVRRWDFFKMPGSTHLEMKLADSP